MLSFYITEVALGKKTESGFPDSSHQELAEQFRKEFPQVRDVHDFNFIKSELTQSFKRDYEAFVACKEAPGFVWDQSKHTVSASDEDWAKILEVTLIHPVFHCFHSLFYVAGH
jgi:hypothetical protein